MNKAIIFSFAFLLLAGTSWPQETKQQAHTLVVNLQAIKEEMNYGLVFRGPGVGYNYSAQWQNKHRILAYEGRISFNFPVTRGIIGGSWNFVPLRFDYLFKTGAEGRVSVGPYALFEYNYEFYPDLQSGFSFWFTHYSLGAALTGWFPVKKSRIDLSMHVSAFGLTSRQHEIEDPYFFDDDFHDIIGYLHSDFRFGTWDTYSQYELEMKWTPKEGSQLAYAYSLQFYGYFNFPSLSMYNNTLKLIFLPKKNK